MKEEKKRKEKEKEKTRKGGKKGPFSDEHQGKVNPDILIFNDLS